TTKPDCAPGPYTACRCLHDRVLLARRHAHLIRKGRAGGRGARGRRYWSAAGGSTVNSPLLREKVGFNPGRDGRAAGAWGGGAPRPPGGGGRQISDKTGVTERFSPRHPGADGAAPPRGSGSAPRRELAGEHETACSPPLPGMHVSADAHHR